MQKQYKIKVDITKKYAMPAFEVNTNDLKSIRLSIEVLNGASPLDLKDKTVRIAIRKPDNNIVFQDCTITDATNGQVEVILENQAYITPGTHTAEIMCYKGNDVVAVSGTFSYKSSKGIMNDEAVESKSEFTAINRTIEEAERILEDLRENGGGVGVDEQARQGIQDVTAQLAEKVSKVNGKVPDENGNVTIDVSQSSNGMGDNVLFFAHRGAEGRAPENTLKAFEIANEMGFDGYELDTQVTSDGHWVLMHDETVDRTTDGTGKVKDMTLEQIRSLNIDAGNFVRWHIGLKVPLLKDVLLFAKKHRKKVYAEVKDTGGDQNLIQLANMINALGMNDSAIILCSYALAEKIHQLNLPLKCSVFYIANSEPFKKTLDYPNVVAVDVYPMTSLSEPLVEELHRKGKKVSTGTINDMETAKRYVAMGADIITGGVNHV